ncbi:MAG: tetratricopeptide repeat protein [Saprospiraceae bacterium]
MNNLLTSEAKLYPLIIDYLIDDENNEENFENYYTDNSTSILLNDALIAKGNYYFRNSEYGRAIDSYEQIDLDGLEYYKEDEVKFKLAYSYFVKQQFDKASLIFKDLSLTQRKYYYPSNYYYGICQFLNSDFDRAINSFDIIQNSPDYKNYIPYYLVQLYFTQGNYNKTIEVGEEKLKLPEVENYYNIHQLVGQSYFIKKEYEKALPHLELYEKNTAKLSESDFYQLGYMYHEIGDCVNSIKNFIELTGLNSQLGQYANYYIADCYLRQNNKESARSAFKNASSLSFDKLVQEESLLNYGKLSSEMGYDREAINTLNSISDNSAYYSEAQSILKGIFINTKDYAAAQKILEDMDNVTPQLYEAYQIVSYYKALQEINDGKYDIATEDLLKAEKISRDIRTSIQTNYW